MARRNTDLPEPRDQQMIPGAGIDMATGMVAGMPGRTQEAPVIAGAEELQAAGIEVILDDRDERPGVKFNDAELIGIPYRITIGRKASEGIVELKKRTEDEVKELTLDELYALLKTL